MLGYSNKNPVTVRMSLNKSVLFDGAPYLEDEFGLSSTLQNFTFQLAGTENNSHKYKITLINPTDNLENAVRSNYGRYLPGLSDSTQTLPQIPAFYIQWGYGGVHPTGTSKIQPGTYPSLAVSKIHQAVLTKTNIRFTSRREKIIELELVDVVNWAEDSKRTKQIRTPSHPLFYKDRDGKIDIYSPVEILKYLLSDLASQYPSTLTVLKIPEEVSNQIEALTGAIKNSFLVRRADDQVDVIAQLLGLSTSKVFVNALKQVFGIEPRREWNRMEAPIFFPSDLREADKDFIDKWAELVAADQVLRLLGVEVQGVPRSPHNLMNRLEDPNGDLARWRTDFQQGSEAFSALQEKLALYKTTFIDEYKDTSMFVMDYAWLEDSGRPIRNPQTWGKHESFTPHNVSPSALVSWFSPDVVKEYGVRYLQGLGVSIPVDDLDFDSLMPIPSLDLEYSTSILTGPWYIIWGRYHNNLPQWGGRWQRPNSNSGVWYCGSPETTHKLLLHRLQSVRVKDYTEEQKKVEEKAEQYKQEEDIFRAKERRTVHKAWVYSLFPDKNLRTQIKDVAPLLEARLVSGEDETYLQTMRRIAGKLTDLVGKVDHQFEVQAVPTDTLLGGQGAVDIFENKIGPKNIVGTFGDESFESAAETHSILFIGTHREIAYQAPITSAKIESFPSMNTGRSTSDGLSVVGLSFGDEDSIITDLQFETDLWYMLNITGSFGAAETLETQATALQSGKVKRYLILFKELITSRGEHEPSVGAWSGLTGEFIKNARKALKKTDYSRDRVNAERTLKLFKRQLSTFPLTSQEALEQEISMSDGLLELLKTFGTLLQNNTIFTALEDLDKAENSWSFEDYGVDSKEFEVFVHALKRQGGLNLLFETVTQAPSRRERQWDRIHGPSMTFGVNPKILKRPKKQGYTIIPSNKFDSYLGGDINEKRQAARIINEYVLSYLKNSAYAIQVTFKTLGVPEIDSMSDLFNRRLWVEVHDTSIEKIKNKKHMHWLSGSFAIIGMKHTISNRGYMTEFQCIKDVFNLTN
jgi:hypothetical protein